MAFVFEDEQPPATASRFVFDDAAPTTPPAKPKGILESAADTFIGAGARVAQAANESLGAINNAFGMEQGAEAYKEGAEYWGKKAEEAGSTGLPAQIYQGIGAAPAGVAEFVAGPAYAGVKGAVQGYNEGGIPGALEKATIEVAKRAGIGKIFHGIENTGISGLPKAAAMGSTMAAQTAAEQAMTDEGIKPQDVAASAITGTLLSVGGGGKSEIIRQNLIQEGVQPDIAGELAGRFQEVFSKNGENPDRYQFEDQAPTNEPSELELATAYNRAIVKSGKGGLTQNTGVSDAQFQDSLLKQYRTDQEAATPSRFTFEDQAAEGPPVERAEQETGRPPISFTDPQGRPLDVAPDNRPPESIGPLVSETGTGSVRFAESPETSNEPAVSDAAKAAQETTPPSRFMFEDQAAEGPPVERAEQETGRPPVSFTDPQGRPLDVAPEISNTDQAATPSEASAINMDEGVTLARNGERDGDNLNGTTQEVSAIETARQAAAENLNSVYPEGSPDIGLAVKPAPKRDDTVSIPQQHTDKSGGFTSTDSKVEERWKAANGLSDGPGLLERTKSFIHRMLSETQHFPELDTSNYSGKRTADILRRFESSAVAAKAKTAEHLHGLTATFGPKKMDIFTRKVILDDLMNEADKGRDLPFGYTPETLQKDHAAVSGIVDTSPDIKAAVERRADVNKALVMDLVGNDLIPVESVLKSESLDSFQKTGTYSADDINTQYFRHQVLEYANARRWAGISTAGDVRNKQRGWQKGREGSEKDINVRFLESEFEVFSQGLKELATKKTLDEVLTLNDLAPELKAQAKKEGSKDWKGLIPDGHTIWQPEQGSVFYRGQTLPEQIVTKFLAENPHFSEIAEKFKEVTILGGKKTEVVIPSGLAKTLDSLRTDRESATLDTVNQKMLGAWKIWTLLSPRRAIKYNLNNMSGDLDAAVAADPGIVIKHFNTAWKNAWNRRAGRAMTPDEIDMLDRGVIDAGISINEIPDINKLPGFSRLSETERQEKFISALRSGDFSKLAPPNVIAKYFHWVSGLSQLREGLLREAAYLRAKELLEQGKKIYWASKPAEIDALPDIRDKAAKLSRELLGDYGNLSAHGERIRTRFIPFWSWMEINAPRYYRLFQNAAARGEAGSTAARLAGVGTRKIAGATLGIAEKVLLTQVLFASVSAFNHLIHPEEEDRLGDDDQQQLHVILGTNSSGKIMTARFQGAFSDALSWFGLEDYPETLLKLKNGKMESGELAKKMLIATPNKIANAAAPFFKLGGELVTGRSIYPDITKPVQVRDKIEHAARFLSLDNEYKALAGKPTRGYLDSLKGLYLYERDPGEAAYNNIRRLTTKYLEKTGKESVSAEPTARSNALYYYKQALRFNDEVAAERYKEEYLAKGGRPEGIKQSIYKAHPMGMLPLNQRAKFRESLSDKELETLTRAVDWYRQVYEP